jgi:phage gp36-like protein
MYCTLEDILKKIPTDTVVQLTDDTDGGGIDEVKTDEAIADAGREIDAYCGSRYILPFAVVPDIIAKLAADIAIYNLYSRVTETIPDTRADRYKNAIKLLEGIAKGAISLGAAATSQAPVVAGKSPQVESSPRLFSRDSMRGL